MLSISQLVDEQAVISRRRVELHARLQKVYEDMRPGQVVVFEMLREILFRDHGDIAAMGITADPEDAHASGPAVSEPVSLEDHEPDDEVHRDTGESPTKDQQTLLSDLDIFWNELNDAEERLENRDEYFYRLKADRVRRKEAGLPIETPSEVDFVELQTTQRMTRRVIQAE
ncbi:hypothetical protein CLAFUW4_00100 [Fulvia fulva]|uniref:Uncharacterized protein n=1 Tax=Passalora fulva TaxID=5499 RepID=A0A9Q8P456_PASFU|nr:uncharacterized protein CLAFUR5_00098 [Fulvia fulva]KAK4635976.1 hypothetical protein CLAFUR4_00100 [Fulvia fulva]KAK4637250.1 hypothetical protein CLAFUR0_00099 [Fulvia fulva]UJO12466.1 hypothetical protein CLAFUR5_00098 [Fulvia fulva]WPV09102.1 hypothetical protein CLAFUW4_00100 [Fulvia fulva]WPV25122.1 hypothetical protein CLAFUW7_00100 [Fulvia fulva]